MSKASDILNLFEKEELILFKLAKVTSEAQKNKIFNSMPDKSGYIKVYKPYGVEGRGFYYLKK